MHRGCLPNGGARGEDFARNEIPHPCCVLYLSAKVWFLSEIAIDPDMVDADDCYIQRLFSISLRSNSLQRTRIVQ